MHQGLFTYDHIHDAQPIGGDDRVDTRNPHLRLALGPAIPARVVDQCGGGAPPLAIPLVLAAPEVVVAVRLQQRRIVRPLVGEIISEHHFETARSEPGRSTRARSVRTSSP